MQFDDGERVPLAGETPVSAALQYPDQVGDEVRARVIDACGLELLYVSSVPVRGE